MTDDDVLLFMGAVHPTQTTKVSYGWIRTGIEKVIETTGSRIRLNNVGTIRLGHLDDTVTKQYEKSNINLDVILPDIGATYPCSVTY